MFENTDDEAFYGAISEEPDLIDALNEQELTRFKAIDERKKAATAPKAQEPERTTAPAAGPTIGPAPEKPIMERLTGINPNSIMPMSERLNDLTPVGRGIEAVSSAGRGFLGGSTAGMATRAAKYQFSDLQKDEQKYVADQYKGEANLPSLLGRVAGTILSPLNKIGGKGIGAQALNQGAQGLVSGVAEERSGGETAFQTLAGAGMPVLGGAVAKYLRGRQPLLPELNPNLPAQEARELTANAFRRIAEQQGADPGDVTRILKDNPEFAEKVVIEYNRGRSQGILGPGLENIRTSKIANRNTANQQAAKSVLNEATQEFPPSLPAEPLVESLEDTEESILRTAGGEARVAVIRQLLEDIRKARAMDPNAAKVAAMARARNPMQAMPEAPPIAATPGDVGGTQAQIPRFEIPEPDPIVGPAYGYSDEFGGPWRSGDLPGFPKIPNEVRPQMRANVGQDIDAPIESGPSMITQEPILVSPEDLPVEGRIPVLARQKSREPSLPVTDPTTMGRIRAAQAQAKPLILPRDSTPSGGSLPEVQGWLDRPGQVLSEGATQSAKAGGSIGVEQPYKDAANALYRGLEDISSPEAVANYRAAVERLKAADTAGEAAQTSAMSSRLLKEGGSARMTAARTLLSPLTDRWNILSQNYYADKLLMTPNISPRMRQVLEWVKLGGSAGAQASRLYVASQKNPELLGLIQEQGEKNE